MLVIACGMRYLVLQVKALGQSIHAIWWIYESLVLVVEGSWILTKLHCLAVEVG